MNPIDHRMIVAVLGSLSLNERNVKSLSSDVVEYKQVFYNPKAKDLEPKPWYREHGNKRRIYK